MVVYVSGGMLASVGTVDNFKTCNYCLNVYLFTLLQYYNVLLEINYTYIRAYKYITSAIFIGANYRINDLLLYLAKSQFNKETVWRSKLI